jgi:hypothetical protein
MSDSSVGTETGVSGTAVGTFGGALNVGANEKLSGNVGPGEKLLTGNVGAAEKLSGNVGPGAKVLTGNVGAAEKLLDMVCIAPQWNAVSIQTQRFFRPVEASSEMASQFDQVVVPVIGPSCQTDSCH